MKRFLLTNSVIIAVAVAMTITFIVLSLNDKQQYGIIDHGPPPVQVMANMDDTEAEYTSDTVYVKTRQKSVQGNDNWVRLTFRAGANGVYVLRGDNVNADTTIDTTINDSAVKLDSTK